MITISLPRQVEFEGLPVAEAMRRLRNRDIVEWLRLEGDVTELFEVGAIEQTRCPMTAQNSIVSLQP